MESPAAAPSGAPSDVPPEAPPDVSPDGPSAAPCDAAPETPSDGSSGTSPGTPPHTPPGGGRTPRGRWIAPLRRRPAAAALVCAAVLAALAWRIGARPELPAFLVLGTAGTALAIVDLATRTLPDPLTLGSYATGAALLGAAAPATADGGTRYLHALLGMAALWLLFAVLWVIKPDALGRGDVKLAGALGLHLGWLGADAWLLGVYGTFVLGGAVAAVLLLTRRAGRGTMLPYGPYMLAAALIAVLVHAP